VRAIVIDDSKAMRLILRRILTKVGFEVVEAADGQEALDLLAGPADPPELALVDWNMPRVDGLEFVKLARREARMRAMTMVMVTSESEQEQIVRALAAGAAEYLLKPFTEGDVLEKLALLGLVGVGANP
jgi:two-component system, chemotaxis family, chemotaxis protein CheY